MLFVHSFFLSLPYSVSAAALKRIRGNKRGGGGQTEGESQKVSGE